MATILITGGTGLIGTALTPMLLSKGYEVIILTRQTSKQKTDVKYARSYKNLYAQNRELIRIESDIEAR